MFSHVLIRYSQKPFHKDIMKLISLYFCADYRTYGVIYFQLEQNIRQTFHLYHKKCISTKSNYKKAQIKRCRNIMSTFPLSNTNRS